MERRELDRHSYEVQIKELTLRIADESNFRAENLKLREFLRKQSVLLIPSRLSSRNLKKGLLLRHMRDNWSESTKTLLDRPKPF